MATKQKSTDLGMLQAEAEAAAKALKGARTTAINAKAALDRAEEAYSIAQKSLTIGMESIKASTRVG